MTDTKPVSVKVRRAVAGDVAATMALLEEVSCEIPLRLDGDERKACVRRLIGDCYKSRKSLVAVSPDGELVGFQLTRPIGPRQVVIDGPEQPAGLMLEYGGVKKAARQQGLFHLLIKETKRQQLPLYAVVRHDNKSQMADRMGRMGFAKIADDCDFPQAHFRWVP